MDRLYIIIWIHIYLRPVLCWVYFTLTRKIHFSVILSSDILFCNILKWLTLRITFYYSSLSKIWGNTSKISFCNLFIVKSWKSVRLRKLSYLIPCSLFLLVYLFKLIFIMFCWCYLIVFRIYEVLTHTLVFIIAISIIAIWSNCVFHGSSLCCSYSCRDNKRFRFLLHLLISFSVSNMTPCLYLPYLLWHIHMPWIFWHCVFITWIYHFIVPKILQLI